MLTEIPKPTAYTIHLIDGRTLINYFVTDATARRWASVTHLSDKIIRVTRDVTVVIYSRDNPFDTSDNSPI